MLKLNESYVRQDFLDFLKEFLPDFEKDVRKASSENLKSIETATYLGKSKKLDLQIFELSHKITSGARIALATDGFRIMKQSASFRALVVYYSNDTSDWRLSLMTLIPEPNEKGKATIQFSNPRRYSFFLGPQAKINTPTKFLISKGQIVDLDDLKNRFSIEVVNKEFYKEISQAFTKLVSGQLKLPSTEDKSQTHLEFAVRMIGRIIFCWFLREKYSEDGVSLMPKKLLSLEATKNSKDYYHNVLEPIFFEILNKPIRSRKEDFAKEPYSLIPYLNGGLFSPQEDDYYRRGVYQSDFYNDLTIPDEWFKDFFEILETYNFTIDENTSYDEELSIDPEMLGRIFENLLAEINPETGESARKSTGSYYTPRVIVNYMVDESLLLYLKNQTGINESKLKAVISYDLIDDTDNPINNEEKEKIIDALEKVKILDPACGSGAFPMGALQKIVFILQQTDPDGQLWFKKQIKNTSPEVRRVVEREFEHKNFDYIRKLGIIRENIYGVDIQAIATEISRLRCFLTLVVDERIQDELENRGIEPLPNLDFKFVTANSLIGLPKLEENINQPSLGFDDQDNINKLKDIRDQYFNASGIEREQLKLEFSEQQKVLIKQMYKEHNFAGMAKSELTQKLTDWEPFRHKSASWFDPEWMFGIKDGFDIVIANPPYGADIDSQVKILAKLYPNTSKGFKDIYKLFIECGIKNLLKLNGSLCFIIPNTLLLQPRYKDARKYLLNFRIQEIVNLGEGVFPQVVVPTCIILVSKDYLQESSLKFLDISNRSKWLGSIENHEASSILQDDYKKTELCLFTGTARLHTQDEYLLDEIFDCKDCGIKYQRVNVGLSQKGNNDLADRLFYNGSRLHEEDQRFLIGKDLHKDGWYIDLKNERYIRHDYKQILRKNEIIYFNKFYFDLEKKIVWRQTSSCFTGTILENKIWFANTLQVGVIRDDYKNKIQLEYLLALLNSKYLRYLYNETVKESGRVFPQVKLSKLKTLPIKKISLEEQQPYVNTVRSILELIKSLDYLENDESKDKVKEFEIINNRMVYKLYNLSSEEIEIVENG